MKTVKAVHALAWCALALVLAILVPAVVRSAAYTDDTATRYNNVRTGNLEITGSGIYDSAGTLRLAPGATNAITGNLTVSGTTTLTGALTTNGTLSLQVSTAPRSSDANVAIVPPAAGSLVYNSTDKELCVSSGTTASTWIEVSTFGVVACRH